MAVIMYSSPSCVFCRQAKDWLRQEGIPFKDYDISRDDRRAEEMFRKSGQMGVPVLDVNGKVIVGFKRPEILRALRR